MVGDGTFTYAYSAAGRMVRAESVTATLVYTYGPDGLRVAQSVDGEETTFAWDLALPLAQVLSTSDGALDVYGLGRVGELRDGEWAYPLPDALGSVRQWTDDSGAVTYAAGYTPYGVEMWQQGGTASAWGYTGEWWDADAELLYLRARWYDGRVGRFTRKDVWPGNHQQPLTMNPYLYAVANPVGFRDPSGRQPYGDAEEAFYDFSGTLAVLWYREMYMGDITLNSQLFSIERVELEAGLYAIGGGEGFYVDLLRHYVGWRQDIAWYNLSRLFTKLGGCTPSLFQKYFEFLAGKFWPPSLGIAQVEPPRAQDIEEYWAKQGGLGADILPPPEGVDWVSGREEWLTIPHIGIRYVAAYVGWSKRELERFKSETGVLLIPEAEWHFVGWNLNGGVPKEEVDNLVEKFETEALPGVLSYWEERGYWASTQGRLYARYMTSPVPQDLTLLQYLMLVGGR